MNYVRRIAGLRHNMKQKGLDGCIILDRSNTHYLTGFRGTSSMIIIMHDVLLFITDFRYFHRAVKDLPPGYEALVQKGDMSDQIKSFFNVRGKIHIGFEPTISYEKYQWLRESVRPARLREASGLLKPLRMIKDEDEISRIKKAASIVDECMEYISKELRADLTEREVAIKIRRFFEDKGAEGESFPTIVASGPNSAVPHHETSNRKLQQGDVVLIDMGCRYEGYCSDMTRTLFLGSATDEEKNIYRIVLEAQKKGLKAVRPGISAGKLDNVVRDAISRAGYQEAFGHKTGHGVGIDIHEPPTVAPSSGELLKEGMIITIEPGIYLPDVSGVRIEDLLMVTAQGAVRLSKFPKELTIL